jgi:hypothetical protein
MREVVVAHRETAGVPGAESGRENQRIPGKKEKKQANGLPY